MFWDNNVIQNLNKACECSETVLAQMGINGKIELDYFNNVIRCKYNGKIFVFNKPIIELTERVEYSLFNAKAIKRRKLGQFDFRSNTITVFVRNIMIFAKEKKVDFDSLVPLVIGHEVFHAVHANLLIKQSRWYDQVKDINAKTVVETLATCFEYLLCKELGGLDEEVIVLDKLNEGNIPNYPYAGSKNIISTDAFYKCGEILEFSRKDWLMAYSVIDKIANEK